MGAPGLNTRQALGRVAKDQRTLLYFEKFQQQALVTTPAAVTAAQTSADAAEAAALAASTAASEALSAALLAQTEAAAAQTTASEALELATNGASVPVTASEPMTARSLVSLWNDAGTGKIRLADATDDTKQVNGFVQEGYGTGNTARMRTGGQITGFSGLTPAALYFLAAGGTITVTRPSTGWLQVVGRAIDDQRLLFAPEDGILL